MAGGLKLDDLLGPFQAILQFCKEYLWSPIADLWNTTKMDRLHKKTWFKNNVPLNNVGDCFLSKEEFQFWIPEEDDSLFSPNTQEYRNATAKVFSCCFFFFFCRVLQGGTYHGIYMRCCMFGIKNCRLNLHFCPEKKSIHIVLEYFLHVRYLLY